MASHCHKHQAGCSVLVAAIDFGRVLVEDRFHRVKVALGSEKKNLLFVLAVKIRKTTMTNRASHVPFFAASKMSNRRAFLAAEKIGGKKKVIEPAQLFQTRITHFLFQHTSHSSAASVYTFPRTRPFSHFFSPLSLFSVIHKTHQPPFAASLYAFPKRLRQR